MGRGLNSEFIILFLINGIYCKSHSQRIKQLSSIIIKIFLLLFTTTDEYGPVRDQKRVRGRYFQPRRRHGDPRNTRRTHHQRNGKAATVFARIQGHTNLFVQVQRQKRTFVYSNKLKGPREAPSERAERYNCKIVHETILMLVCRKMIYF